MDTLPPAPPEAAELEAEVEAAVLLEPEPPQAASAPAAATAPATVRTSRREMKCFIMSSPCHALSNTGRHVQTIRCSCLSFYKGMKKKSILLGQLFENFFQSNNSEQHSLQNAL